ncbi:Carbamoyl-phosphate synthase small chain [Agromyces sp. NDB4Y10]|uniref:glutamine amidotransferase-related protein n=1 Tax=Agromyces sp. NDB4Y10 TaxID=1775951 RepID=UPI0007B24902|nr:gamma-glutamyl-gamma-aminobutyrate hydrolase family protein [Agromyces sp. NDB4Y10]KZE93528.1 Carbamoyl-phosphate synthase small chain [Agromyces sp. NDB4Y10]
MTDAAGRPTALVLRHDSAIGLGNLGPVLEEHGYEVVVVDAPREDVTAVDALAPDLVVVLGGDEAAYETDRYPYVGHEIELLRQRVAAEAPVFGVCLGAQMLAEAMGSRAYRGPRKEVGWLGVDLTEAGASSPVRHARGIRFVQWHGDTFDLPEGVERLASSPQYANQAFRAGDWLLAVQFHPEVTPAIHEDWLAAWGDELPEYDLTVERMRALQGEHGPAAEAASRAILGEFLDGLGQGRRAGSSKKSTSSFDEASASTPA